MRVTGRLVVVMGVRRVVVCLTGGVMAGLRVAPGRQ